MLVSGDFGRGNDSSIGAADNSIVAVPFSAMVIPDVNVGKAWGEEDEMFGLLTRGTLVLAREQPRRLII